MAVRWLLIVAGLAGCQAQVSTQVGQVSTILGQLNAFTAADLKTASDLAKAAGDDGPRSGAACWDFLAVLWPVLTSGQPGAATGIEITRLPTQPAFVAACGEIGPSLPISPTALIGRIP